MKKANSERTEQTSIYLPDTKVVLGVDLATVTGWAMVKGWAEDGRIMCELLDSGLIDCRRKGESSPLIEQDYISRMGVFYQTLCVLLQSQCLGRWLSSGGEARMETTIAYEAIPWGADRTKTSVRTTEMLLGLRGCLLAAIYNRELHWIKFDVVRVQPAAWHRLVFKDAYGTAKTIAERKALSIDMAQLLTGVRPDNHHVADAIGIAFYAIMRKIIGVTKGGKNAG